MKLLLVSFLMSLTLLAQSSGVGSNWTAVTGTLQNAATSGVNGSTLSVQGLSGVAVTVNCSVACTGGTTITFQGSQDGSNYSSLEGIRLDTGIASTTVVNQGTTPTVWLVPVSGLQLIRAPISAYSAGTITVTATAVGASSNLDIATILGTPTINVTQFGSNAVVTGTGASGTGIPRVTISNDSSLAANQSVNVAQFNGVTPLMGNGVSGTGSQRMNIASDNTAIAGWGQGATGSAVPSGAVYMGLNGSGNLTGGITCDNSAFYDTNTNGATQMVGLVSGKKIYICGFNFAQSTTTAVHVGLEYGTGTNCASGATKITPAYLLQAATATGPVGIQVTGPAMSGGLAVIASNELCILTDAAVSVQALVWYTQF